MTDQPQNLRGLKAAVGIMGVLIIVGSTVVIGTIIHRLYARFAAPSTPAAPAASAPPPGMALQPLPAAALPGAQAALQPGEHIAGIASVGPSLAVWVNGPRGDRLVLLDPATGQARTLLSSP